MLLTLVLLLSTAFCGHCQQVNIIQSARDTGDRLTQKQPVQFSKNPGPGGISVNVDSSTHKQEILGFGGALTESAAVTFGALTPSLQNEVIEAYFGSTGHGYTVCRTHINSCDFSVASYSFDDTPNDYELKNFDISHNKQYLFPLINRALSASKRPIKIFGTPWSPPAWMKSNHQMDGSNQPGLIQDPKIFQSWALFLSKTITEYQKIGINLWGITIQNEPEFAAPWEACCYNPSQQLAFLKGYLGPQFARDHPNVTIMIFDHNKDHVVDWVRTIFSDPDGAKYAQGTAVHWYSGPQFPNLAQAHQIAPNKFILATEACNCPPQIGNWGHGENYGQDIIGDLNNWVVGWTDWNILLNSEGGPNHLNNFCDAPILADISSQKLIYQPAYWYMGHFARYVLPGSFVLNSAVSDGRIGAVATVNSGNNYVVVVQNVNDQVLNYTLKHGNNYAQISAPGHSIQTLVYTLN